MGGSSIIPGSELSVVCICRFPGQQMVGGDSKIPSVVCYDANGVVVGVGSEADSEINPDLEESDVAEW